MRRLHRRSWLQSAAGMVTGAMVLPTHLAARAGDLPSQCGESLDGNGLCGSSLQQDCPQPLAAAPELPGPSPLTLHGVRVPVQSYRLLAMSRDESGGIWAGSIHRSLHAYDPPTGRVQTIPLPYDATASACLCVGQKVYVLGQTYPRLIVYDRSRAEFYEKAYPSPAPNVWYGTEAVDNRFLYLFDRGGAGVIKWDAEQEAGRAIAWPYPVPLPSGGRIEKRDQALWCYVWDMAGGQYVPLGIARFDLGSDSFSGWYPFPDDAGELDEYDDPANTFFLPHTLRGRLVPFDFQCQRWCRAIPVPRFGELFGFMGGGVEHDGRFYYSLSTYNGTDVGCDGRPYHFCNAILEWDPLARGVRFVHFDGEPGSYYQVAYMLSAGGDFFATGTNIATAEGTLDRDRAGEVQVWQTVRKPGS
jgi:hypothetical protein